MPVPSPPTHPAAAPPASGLTARASRRLAAGTGAAGVTGCVLVALVDPAEPGRYGLCPFYAATGLWCPLCGSLRAVHHLARLDLTAAAGSNALVLVLLPLVAYAWAAWALPVLGLRGPPRPRWRPATWWGLGAALVVALIAFGIMRNLPAFAWLAPEALAVAR